MATKARSTHDGPQNQTTHGQNTIQGCRDISSVSTSTPPLTCKVEGVGTLLSGGVARVHRAEVPVVAVA